jgi:autoinducer 2-degrading protein
MAGSSRKERVDRDYRTSDDPAEHKKTAHYQTWRDTVADMMAEPRSSVKYGNVFPDDEGWG